MSSTEFTGRAPVLTCPACSGSAARVIPIAPSTALTAKVASNGIRMICHALLIAASTALLTHSCRNTIAAMQAAPKRETTVRLDAAIPTDASHLWAKSPSATDATIAKIQVAIVRRFALRKSRPISIVANSRRPHATSASTTMAAALITYSAAKSGHELKRRTANTEPAHANGRYRLRKPRKTREGDIVDRASAGSISAGNEILEVAKSQARRVLDATPERDHEREDRCDPLQQHPAQIRVDIRGCRLRKQTGDQYQ